MIMNALFGYFELRFMDIFEKRDQNPAPEDTARSERTPGSLKPMLSQGSSEKETYTDEWMVS